MKEQILTISEQRLVLETKISERSLIIYVIESSLMDEDFPDDYQLALKDEIQNHKLAIDEYKESLKQMNK